MIYARINSSNVVVNLEVAENEWANEWNATHGNNEDKYSLAFVDAGERYSAVIGSTYDERTGWFIPPSPDPEYVFDRGRWEWLPPSEP